MADLRGFDGLPRLDSGDPAVASDVLRQQAVDAAAVRDQLAQVTGEASSDNGFVRAVVGITGLQALVLDPRAMRMPSEDLAAAVVTVTAQARDALDQRRIERARELGIAQDRPDLDESLAQLSRLQSLVQESQGDARRVFERFRDETQR